MRYGHSWRDQRRPTRLHETVFSAPHPPGAGYDAEDMQELDRLIVAKVKTPRAELERPVETAAEALRRMAAKR